MCIIIVKNKGVEPLDIGYFERAWDHNGDGGGIVWKAPEDDCAYVQKGFMKKEDMLEKLKEINKKENSFIAHFRIRSVGEVNPSNTHPFVMDKVTFAHNGTITSLHPLEGKTDSETFGLAFLKTRSMKWIKENQLLLELALGSSKFAIMDNKTGEILILNKEKGKEQDGAWFSNSSADKPVIVPTRTNYDFYDSGYSGYYNQHYGCGSYGSGALIKARAFFGTKSFSLPFCEWSKEKKCFVYSATKAQYRAGIYDDSLVVSRNGLWKLEKSIRPKDYEFEKKHYGHRAKEFKMIGEYQQLLLKELQRYRGLEFDFECERADQELIYNAMNIVLDSARRFIADEVELNEDNLIKFILLNINLSNWYKQSDARKQEYGEFVELLTETIMDFASGQPMLLI